MSGWWVCYGISANPIQRGTEHQISLVLLGEVRLPRGASTSTTMKWKRQGPSRQESQVAQHEASPNVMDKPLPRHIFWVNVTIFTDET
jgi:hypothetical protein